jgi:hypothetical protein
LKGSEVALESVVLATLIAAIARNSRWPEPQKGDVT